MIEALDEIVAKYGEAEVLRVIMASARRAMLLAEIRRTDNELNDSPALIEAVEKSVAQYQPGKRNKEEQSNKTTQKILVDTYNKALSQVNANNNNPYEAIPETYASGWERGYDAGYLNGIRRAMKIIGTEIE